MYYNFDRFHGKPRVKTIYDWARRGYQEVVAIDIGSNIHQPIRLPPNRREVSEKAIAPEKRLRGRKQQVVAYLKKHQSATMAEIATALGTIPQDVRNVLVEGRDLFVREEGTRPAIWRLKNME